MAVPNNILQTVRTYQMAEMAWLLNSNCAISLSNKKFQNFDSLTANLGDTVTFDLAPRSTTTAGLVIVNQPSVQRVQSLSCTQAANNSQSYSDQQFIFNVQEYMKRFGMSAVKEIGTQVEADLLRNIISGVTVSDPQNPLFGTRQINSGPYRFYGDGVTPINSYNQLAQACANFRAYGASTLNMCGILPEISIPAIIGTGLNQFAMNRNNDIANSWELGEFSRTKWYESNLLPIHFAGDIGNATAPNNVMTVISTNDPTGRNVTAITFSEPTGGSNPNAIKAGDMMQFIDVPGLPNMRTKTFIGHITTQLPVQFVATSDAVTVGGVVTVTLRTATDIGLVSAPTQNQNLNNAIQAGMKVQVVPSHLAGLIMSGDPLYMAMPKLPDQSPYDTVSEIDKESGVSMRHYWGAMFGQNQRSYVRDIIWGSTLVPENCMRLIFPLNSLFL